MSGAPGTGKTATLTHLLSTKLGKYRTIFINCMILKSSINIYKEVAKQLSNKKASSSAKTEKEALREIEKVITAKGETILLILDEVDQLDSKNQGRWSSNEPGISKQFFGSIFPLVNKKQIRRIWHHQIRGKCLSSTYALQKKRNFK